jgi:hypothetical protein
MTMSVANPDVEPVGWKELHADLVQWVDALDDEGEPANGPPGKDRELLALAAKELGPLGHDPPGGAAWLLKAFVGKSDTLIPSLANRPTWVPAFTGNANDPLHVGEYLFRTRVEAGSGRNDLAPAMKAEVQVREIVRVWIRRTSTRQRQRQRPRPPPPPRRRRRRRRR